MSKQETKAKESYFAKKTKRDSEKRVQVAAHISKIIAKYHAEYGEPVTEIDDAYEQGIEVGKKHNKLNFEDRVREEVAKKKDELIEMAKNGIEEDIEAEVEKRVQERMKATPKNDAHSLTKKLLELQESEGGVGIVLTANFKQKVGDGIVAAAGSTRDHVKMLMIAAKAHDVMEEAILLAARDIVARTLERKPCDHCGRCH